MTVTDCSFIVVAAGLSERDTDKLNVRTHGTEDTYDIAVGYTPSSPEQSARTLKNKWTVYNKDNQKKKPELARVENAESFLVPVEVRLRYDPAVVLCKMRPKL